MRSLHRVLGLLLVLVPGLAASCSGDTSSDEPGGGGDDGSGGEQTSGGDATSGGKQTSGGKSSNEGGERTSAGEANAGASNGGAAGNDSGQAGADEGGASGNAGAGNGGSGADAGAGGGGGAGGEGPVALSHVIVFDAGPHNGLNFGGRVGLDQHCATAKASKSIPGVFTHAFISVSAADEMRDMPTLYGVPTNLPFLGPTSKHVADNWADLLDGSIDQSLTDAGVSSAQFWISGSNADGSVRSTCNGWTTSEFSDQVMGTYGYPTSSNSLWITITDGDVYCSSSQYNVICLAY